MSISSQLPPIPLAQASPMLRALAQASGQSIEARVVAQLPNGTTQVQAGRQAMNLQLPASVAVGTVLTLSVQQSEGQVRMALVSALPPTAGGVSAPANPTTVPAASVHLSPAAQAVPMPASGASQAGANTALSQAGVQTAPVTGQPLTGASVPSPGVQQASAATSQPAAPSTIRPAGAEGTAASAGQPTPGAGTAAGARASIPYAVAAPIISAGATAQTSGSATTALPPVVQPVVAGNVGQHASAPMSQTPTGSSAPAPQMAQAATPSPANPQAALTQMVQQALSRQDSVVGLTQALTGVIGRVALPEPVAKAAQQVLSQRLSLDGALLDGGAVQKAVRSSGIFQEAMLAAGQGKTAGADMKSALLNLQRQLGAWLGDQDPLEQVHNVPPPLRGMIPRAKAGNAPLPDVPDDPQSAGKILLERTEAALSRLRLHQNASLPEPMSRHEAQWSLDLPVIVGGQQSLLHMQIHKDADGGDARPEDRGWQVRFAINLSELGEVGAQISLRGGSTSVLIWADQPDIAAVLEAGVGTLRQELEALGLNTGAIVIRAGAPSAAASPAAATGHIVDAVR